MFLGVAGKIDLRPRAGPVTRSAGVLLLLLLLLLLLDGGAVFTAVRVFAVAAVVFGGVCAAIDGGGSDGPAATQTAGGTAAGTVLARTTSDGHLLNRSSHLRGHAVTSGRRAERFRVMHFHDATRDGTSVSIFIMLVVDENDRYANDNSIKTTILIVY